MSARVPVTFLPSGATVWVAPGTTVLEASRVAGAPVSAPCGGRGVCGSCGVRIVAGSLAEVGKEEKAILARAPKGVRLACRAMVSGAVTVRAVVSQPSTIAVKRQSAGERLVAGVDLGTTNVAAVIVDAQTGREVARSTTPNLQSSFGSDVLSRVTAAAEGRRDDLAVAAQQSVVAALRGAAGDALSRVERVVVAGNSVMAALLTGADVRGLASSPFTAPAPEPLSSDEPLRTALDTMTQVSVVPPIASFVGGDVLAGLVAIDALEGPEPLLLVDMGTNAEVAVVARGRLTVASAPAGPAFEGGGIRCGGPAVEGAVSGVSVSGQEVELETIGRVAPLWLSGAGLVSALAVLRRAGHIDENGLLTDVGPLRKRVFTDPHGVLALRLGDEESDLVITQLDIRAFQLAKAAVAVAVSEALAAAGVRPSKLARVIVAGAFGAALEVEDVVGLGVLSERLAPVIESPGNTSLQGAAALAFDPTLLDAWATVIEKVDHVELASDTGFTERLMEALALEPVR